MRPPDPPTPTPPPQQPTQPTQHEQTLCLAWLNCHGAKNRITSLHEFAERSDATVLALSETWVHSTNLDHQSSPYDWTAGQEYQPSATPIPNTHTAHLDPNNNNPYGGRPKGGMGVLCHTDRGCVVVSTQRHTQWVRVPTGTNKVVYMCSVYAPQSLDKTARQEFWIELQRGVDTYRSRGVLAIGGDFNGRLAMNGDTLTNAAGKELQEFAERNRLTVANALPCAVGELSFCKPIRKRNGKFGVAASTIDYVLVEQRFEQFVQRVCIDATNDVGSDHKPITLHLDFAPAQHSTTHPPPPPAPNRWRRHELDEAKEVIEGVLDDDMQHWLACIEPQLHKQCQSRARTPQQTADTIVRSFQQHLSDSVCTVVPKRQIKSVSTYVTDGDNWPLSARPHMFRSTAYHQFRGMRRAAGWLLHLAMRRKDQKQVQVWAAVRAQCESECKRMCRQLRAEHARKSIGELERGQTSDKTFWQTWDRVRSSALGACTIPKVVKRPDGTVVTDFEEWAQVWSQHFSELGAPNQPTTEASAQFATALRETVNQIDPNLNASARAALECPITEQELSVHIKKLKRGKAVGHDQLPAEVLRMASSGLRRALVVVFNRLLELTVWPTEWWYGLIVPIAKPGADRSNPNDYRGITVLPVLSKLFESVINERIAAFLERTSALSDLQGGFRSDRSTLDQLFLLNEAIGQSREQGRPLYLAFLDVTKAYDKCWRDGLAMRMRECGLTARIIQLLRQSQANVQRSVVVRGHTGPRLRFDTGVPQGAVTSPVLYAMFIDGLARLLESSGCGAVVCGEHLPGLLYADDIALLASTPAHLQRMLDICTEYAEQMQFEFNAKKSNVLVIGPPQARNAAQQLKWTVGGNRITMTDSYKYLGLPIGHNAREGTGANKWRDTLQQLRAKAFAAVGVLQATVGTGKRYGACAAVQIKLWEALVLPTTKYGCAIWGPELSTTQRTALDAFQHRVMRSVLRCGSYVASAFIRGECGLRHITNHCDELALRYFGRLCSMPKDDRVLARVFEVRLNQVLTGTGGKRSWCYTVRKLFVRYGLTDYLTGAKPMPEYEQWSKICRVHTLRHSNQQWREEVQAKSTLQPLYASLKSFPEIEPMLRSNTNPEGNHLKLMARAGTLPLNHRCADLWHKQAIKQAHNAGTTPTHNSNAHTVDAKAKEMAGCKACGSGANEDLNHFFFQCNTQQYKQFEVKLQEAMSLCGGEDVVSYLSSANERDRLRVMLGSALDSECDQPQCDTQSGAYMSSLLRSKPVRSRIDRVVKNYLLMRWRQRCDVAGVPQTVSFRGSYAIINGDKPTANGVITAPQTPKR